MALLRTALMLTATVLVAQDPSLETLRQEGRWKQLRPRIEGWYQAKPADPYALLWMSRVKQAFGDPEGALELARKAAAAQAADPDIQAQLGMAAGECAGRSDGMLKQFSFAKEMRKALEAVQAVRPGDESMEYLMMFYLQAPAIAGGGTGKAKELAQRVTQVNPVSGLLMQSTIAFRAKDLEGARGFVQQALAKDPNAYKAHLAMASYHLSQKPQALDAALACYRSALAANPKGISAYAQTAAILAEQGKWAELDACLAQARKAVPDNLLPYYSAGKNLLSEDKSLDKAEAFLKAYLAQEPEGNAPDRAAARWRIAQVYEKQGKKAEAIAELEQALKLRPSLKQAEKDLARLKKG